jgi:Ca-activated chloride channel family protein
MGTRQESQFSLQATVTGNAPLKPRNTQHEKRNTKKEHIMKKNQLKNFILIAVLILATGGAMAYSSNKPAGFFSNWVPSPPHPHPGNDKILMASGHLVQNKVLVGSDGTVGLNLTLQANDLAAEARPQIRDVDMVIVLDRSGSMQGRKLEDARRAVLELLSTLSAEDRFGMATYSEGVQITSGLVNVTEDNRARLAAAVNGVRAGGGTNLGAGLQAGIRLLRAPHRSDNAARIILISDGLANRGITDMKALTGIASSAVEGEFSISTVGVGADFNEQLMTAIADRGAGTYYYLENPAAFAEVFQQEFHHTRTAAITGLKIQIPVNTGITLSDAGGYPITIHHGQAVFYPGNLGSGQTRKLYLTLHVPTNRQRTFGLDQVQIHYQHNDRSYATALDQSYTIACVTDQRKVYSSIDKTSWSEKVINEDFNRLKQEVASDIKSGKKQEALKRIEKYHDEQQALNAVVGSAGVADNLDHDVKELKTMVKGTFKGAPAAVHRKQKSNAKSLQYEGYRGRRSN